LRVYNTLTRQKEDFQTVHPGKVGMYVCGPTVYKPSHVGHMVGPVIFDTVKRYLTYLGYDVTWVVNITDVGHAVGDGDEGEDKVELGARREPGRRAHTELRREGELGAARQLLRALADALDAASQVVVVHADQIHAAPDRGDRSLLVQVGLLP